MTDSLGTLESMVAAALAQETLPSPEHIRTLISALRATPMCANVDDEAAEALARRFEERLGVTMTLGAVVTDKDYRPWLDEARPQITPYYWERYRKLLIDKNFPTHVLATLDSVTDRILGLMENPAKDGPWDRRGLVVGHVQSGKTASYIGLISKAADAGYKLIVVIAGIHNNLRNQTQLRIDEGFVGRDSSKLLSKHDTRFIGVGRFDNTRRPVTFTNSVRDFNKTTATGVGVPLQNLNEPAVFVIKKNPSTLQNLLEWLQEHSARSGSTTVDAPMLLIDDEADNASINIRYGGDGASKINSQIRDLLKMFDRSCYVGYTATPFANIFIDPDTDDEMRGADLFPRNFIVSLDPPSNYVGPNRVFLNGSEEIIRHIDDNEDWLPLSHKKDLEVTALPPSLIDAIRTFVVGRAIRLCRGHDRAHCSMLVNASRFTDVQRQLRNEIHEHLKTIQASVRINGALPDAATKDPEIGELFAIWQKEFMDTGIAWDEVQQQLNDAAGPISVVEVNSRSAGTLNYADHEATGLNVIAVGGFSLSRGLTLEGLMVSYFLRNSMMYDTLMQMGRWFGYRPDYEDLCRIWMPEEAEGWYAHIAESIELLREELRSMEAAGATPEEFGLKVRSHPDTLIVTARNKMGSGEEFIVSVGLGNSFVETAILKCDEASLQANRKAARNLCEAIDATGVPLRDATRETTGWLLREVPVGPVLEFLAQFRNHPGSILTDGDPIQRYIRERSHSELASWDILFASLQGTDGADDILPIPVIPQHRTAGSKSRGETLLITNKQRVASRGIESTGLKSDQINQARAEYLEQLASEGKTPSETKNVNYPDRIYRSKRERPLLIVHLLKVSLGDATISGAVEQPVVAWSLSFPASKMEETRVQYIVNTTWLRESFRDDGDDEELTNVDD